MSDVWEVYFDGGEARLPLVQQVTGLVFERIPSEYGAVWAAKGLQLDFMLVPYHRIVDEPGLPFTDYTSCFEALRIGPGGNYVLRNGVASLVCTLLAQRLIDAGSDAMLVGNGQVLLDPERACLPGWRIGASKERLG